MTPRVGVLVQGCYQADVGERFAGVV